MSRNDPIGDDDIIHRYTIQQAEEDGILFGLDQVNPRWKYGFFSHITTNLLRKGYIEPDPQGRGERIKLANLVDLLNQCNKPMLKDFTAGKLDSFYSPKIEFPDGLKRDVFIELNELRRYTIMLPEDH